MVSAADVAFQRCPIETLVVKCSFRSWAKKATQSAGDVAGAEMLLAVGYLTEMRNHPWFGSGRALLAVRVGCLVQNAIVERVEKDVRVLRSANLTSDYLGTSIVRRQPGREIKCQIMSKTNSKNENSRQNFNIINVTKNYRITKFGNFFFNSS